MTYTKQDSDNDAAIEANESMLADKVGTGKGFQPSEASAILACDAVNEGLFWSDYIKEQRANNLPFINELTYISLQLSFADDVPI